MPTGRATSSQEPAGKSRPARASAFSPKKRPYLKKPSRPRLVSRLPVTSQRRVEWRCARSMASAAAKSTAVENASSSEKKGFQEA
jgi:hypothetical protein